MEKNLKKVTKILFGVGILLILFATKALATDVRIPTYEETQHRLQIERLTHVWYVFIMLWIWTIVILEKLKKSQISSVNKVIVISDIVLIFLLVSFIMKLYMDPSLSNLYCPEILMDILKFCKETFLVPVIFIVGALIYFAKSETSMKEKRVTILNALITVGLLNFVIGLYTCTYTSLLILCEVKGFLMVYTSESVLLTFIVCFAFVGAHVLFVLLIIILCCRIKKPIKNIFLAIFMVLLTITLIYQVVFSIPEHIYSCSDGGITFYIDNPYVNY